MDSLSAAFGYVFGACSALIIAGAIIATPIWWLLRKRFRPWTKRVISEIGEGIAEEKKKDEQEEPRPPG